MSEFLNVPPDAVTTGDATTSESFVEHRENESAVDCETSEGEITGKESVFSASMAENEPTDVETSSSTMTGEAFLSQNDNRAVEMEETARKTYEELLAENEELRHLLDSRTSQISELEGNYQLLLEQKKFMSKKIQDVQKSTNEQKQKLEMQILESSKINDYLQGKVEKLKTGVKELNQMMFEAILQLNSNVSTVQTSSSSPSSEPFFSTSTALIPFTATTPSFLQGINSPSKLHHSNADNVPRDNATSLKVPQIKENREATPRRSQRVSAFSAQIQRCLESIPPSHTSASSSCKRKEQPVMKKKQHLKKSAKRVQHAVDTRYTEDAGFLCTCGLSFPSKLGVTNHIKYHTFQKMFRCTALGCGRRFYATSYLKDHMKAQHGVIYTGREGCRRCGKTFMTRKQLTWHCKRAHNCGPGVRRRSQLQKDFSSFSSQSTDKQSPPRSTPGPSVTTIKTLEKRRYEAEDKLGLIKKSSDPPTQQQRNDPELSLFQIPHKLNSSPPKDGRVHCVCGRSFSAKQYLTMHIKYFATEPKFKCQLCGKLYNHVNYLRVHMKFKHEQAFEGGSGCKLCGRIFRTRMAFNQHCKNVHSNDGDSSASGPTPVVAQRDTSLRRDRKVPAKYSMDSTPVRQPNPSRISVDESGVSHSADLNCPMEIKCTCGISFTSHSALLNHVNLKGAGGSSGRNYGGRASKTGGSASAIIDASHGVAEMDPERRLFKCLCGDHFASQNILKNHIQLLSISTEFICKICSNSFSRHDYLKVHLMKVHKVVLPAGMTCRLCGCGGFASSVEIKKHRKLHHNIEDMTG